MNITVTNIKKELEKNYGWENLNCEDKKWFIDCIIKDTLSIINDKLTLNKNISITKRKTK